MDQIVRNLNTIDLTQFTKGIKSVAKLIHQELRYGVCDGTFEAKKDQPKLFFRTMVTMHFGSNEATQNDMLLYRHFIGFPEYTAQKKHVKKDVTLVPRITQVWYHHIWPSTRHSRNLGL